MGDPQLQSKICLPNVAQKTIEAWLRGGDVEAGSSAYRYSFMPISDFLTNVDFDEFYEAALTLEKAVEYSNCPIGQNPPMYGWSDSGCRCVRRCENGGKLDPKSCTCKCRGNGKQVFSGPTCSETHCVRRCENGGKLDPASCTCKCRGNRQHGFTGPTCSETYGTCQPGINTGNPSEARKCPQSGNCASWSVSHRCKNTDVCCATSIGTKCCPFGSTCQCSWNKCKCMGR